MWVQSLGQEDSLEKGMINHSSTLAWRIPWTEEPGGLQSMGSQRVGHDWVTNTHTQTLFWASQVVLVVKNLSASARDINTWFDPWVRKIPWRRTWQPIPVFLPGESHGQRSLEGYSPWGRKESDMTERLTQEWVLIIKSYLLIRTVICFNWSIK